MRSVKNADVEIEPMQSARKAPAANTWLRFLAALLIGWVVLWVAGSWYASHARLRASAVKPVLAAFLLEYSFYLVPGFESVRRWLRARVPRPLLALLLTIAAVLPYLAYSPFTHQFQREPL